MDRHIKALQGADRGDGGSRVFFMDLQWWPVRCGIWTRNIPIPSLLVSRKTWNTELNEVINASFSSAFQLSHKLRYFWAHNMFSHALHSAWRGATPSICRPALRLRAPMARWCITSELKRTIRPYQQIRVLAVGARFAIAPVICGLAGTWPWPATAPWPLQTLKSHRGHRRAPGAGAFVHMLSGKWIGLE